MRLLVLRVLLVAAAGLLAATGSAHMALVLLVFALGALVGFVEVLVRFRDEPFQAASSIPGVVYFAINGMAATAIYVLIRYFGEQAVTAAKPVP